MKEVSGSNHKDLDFEISFYENLIKKKKDFIEALIPLAEAYTRKGLYGKGLEIDKRLAGLKKDDEIVHYNLACSYSLVNHIQKSYNALEKAFALGYCDMRQVMFDKDLDNLRKDKNFISFIEKQKEMFHLKFGRKRRRRNHS